jgi:hypothetical protein
MKQTTLLILLSAALLTTGCKTHKTVQEQLPIVPIETNTDTKIVHIETIDTVFIDIPAQSAERTTPGKESHLETDYAESGARINEDGTLTHNLRNKPTKHPVPVKNERDTVYVDRAIEIPVPVEVPVAIERELTWWEKTRLNTWGWLAAVVVLRLVWICRKPIVTLARRLLTKKP